MDISGRRLWQQAAGDTDRVYVPLCFKWGVILNGPGDEGPWPECQAGLTQKGVSSRKRTDLKRFAEEVSEGDIVVLRLGTSHVVGVGIVVGGYEHNEEFGDIDGWDIQHIRRVQWLWISPHDPAVFDTYTLKQGDTTQELTSIEVIRWLECLEPNESTQAADLPDLPAHDPERKVSIEDISRFLFDHGVASDSIAQLVSGIGELTRIAYWYQRTGMPSEHETVAYLVIPLLRALGWTPQRMGIEWNKLDVALFKCLPRSDQTVAAVVEAKKMNDSCLTAFGQAAQYASGKDECRRLVVTDGLRYGVYTRIGQEDFVLNAYMNLTRLRSEYPVYGCSGATRALLVMSPDWVPD